MALLWEVGDLVLSNCKMQKQKNWEQEWESRTPYPTTYPRECTPHCVMESLPILFMHFTQDCCGLKKRKDKTRQDHGRRSVVIVNPKWMLWSLEYTLVFSSLTLLLAPWILHFWLPVVQFQWEEEPSFKFILMRSGRCRPEGFKLTI